MDERTTYREMMEAELHQWEAELERWRVQDERVDGDAQLRREQQQMLDNLHDRRLQARQYLDQLDRADDWTQVKAKIDTLWAEIRAQIAAIKARA